jgi:hypothetical protein
MRREDIASTNNFDQVWKDVALNKYFTFLRGQLSNQIEAAMKTIADVNAGVGDIQTIASSHFDGQIRLTTLRKLTRPP